eukprot:scaffold2986_cov249-Pinguiococcus_pyrenoidosus.AAC.2
MILFDNVYIYQLVRSIGNCRGLAKPRVAVTGGAWIVDRWPEASDCGNASRAWGTVASPRQGGKPGLTSGV